MDSTNKQQGSLPFEIITKIFCNLEYTDLCRWKSVCSYWCRLIEEILQLESISVSNEKFKEATNIFCTDEFREFHIYHAPYEIKDMISCTYINRQTNNNIQIIHELEHIEIFEILLSETADADTCNDPIGSIWRTVLAMMDNEDCTVDELRNKNYKSEYVASFMGKYDWYRFRANNRLDIGWQVGIIALYPDRKTFSMVIH